MVAWSFTRLSTVTPWPLPDPWSISLFLMGLLALSVATHHPLGRLRCLDGWLFVLLAFLALRGLQVETALVALLAMAVQTEEDRQPLRRALDGIVVLFGIWSVVFMVTNPPTPYTALARFSGPVGDPNDLSQVVILSMLPALFAVSRAVGRARILAAVVVGFGLTAVFASHSRASISIVVLLVALVAARAARTRPKLSILLAAGLAVGVGLVPFKFWWRFFRLLNGQDLGHRVELLQAGIQMFTDNPMFGVGLGNFRAHAGGLDAHNLTLEVFAEGGLVAGLPWLLLVGVALRRAWQGRAAALGMAAIAPVCVALTFVGQMEPRVVAIALAIPWLIRAPQLREA